MNSTPAKKSRHSIDRARFLRLLDAALECKAYRFGRQAALSWLAIFPGDLEVMLLQAELMAEDGKHAQALELLKRLIEMDPDYLESYQALARLSYQKDALLFAQAISSMHVLGDQVPANLLRMEWVGPLDQVNAAVIDGNLEGAREILHGVLGQTNPPLLAISMHLRLTARMEDAESLLHLAELYRTQYPNLVPALMYRISALMELGQEPEAVALLHQCVSLDSAGIVARRVWGKEHPYQSIWPEDMAVLFDIPIPAEVAVRLSGAWLPQGQVIQVPAVTEPVKEEEEAADLPAVEETSEGSPEVVAVASPTAGQTEAVDHLDPEQLGNLQKRVEKIAKDLNRPAIARSDGRYPVYVIFSSMKGLSNQYGPQTAGVIDVELRRLAEAVSKRTGWQTVVFYPDDEKSMSKLGLTAVNEVDPWKFKLSLADLDKALAKKGAMIGMLMIIGGPQVVPFHELPNPTDDYDEKIFSDNPYATLDSNYFVPEWPIGRLPGEAGKDAGMLLEQLRFLIANHARSRRIKSMSEGSVLYPFIVLLQNLMQAVGSVKDKGNTGYSAEVWRRASTAVFKPVGNPTNLMVSPPKDRQNVPVDRLLKAEIGYYNLHGMEDGAEWYGQRDPAEQTEGPDYPVALSPAQLKKNGHAPRVVFSEACYGAHIINKSGDSAMSLKFLSLGTLAVIGSTCIAYGAVNTPLVAADLLGNYFWQQMKGGRTAGEALMVAKVEMAREMIKRQGYLDAEDQKTLLSFVLYGDPLATINSGEKRGKLTLRFKKHPSIKTVEEKPVESGETSPISFQVLDDVKQKLAPYLPGIESAEIRICALEGAPALVTTKGKKEQPGKRYVVTVSKSVPFARSVHRHYARVTLASDGKVIKLAVSR